MVDAAKDLIILVADRDMEQAMQALLRRPQALHIRPVNCDIYVHPHRDPGCRLNAHDFLRFSLRSHAHALVMFDREGCGALDSPHTLSHQVLDKLARNGWRDRCAVMVLDPELEVWVWSPSPHVDYALGWRDRQPSLRAWLRQQGYLGHHEHKPSRPKEAMEAALREVRKARSSSLYAQLAGAVSLTGCSEPAFSELCAILQEWFPPT